MTAGRHQEAIAGFKLALRLDPSLKSSHLWLAACYEAIGDTESAAREASLWQAGDG